MSDRNDETPSASIVITNYNYAAYLPACIDSALAQRYDDLQVIVVDDGSTDDSRALIENYGNRVVSVFKENGGQMSAWNYGVKHCTGDVVVFLDADDYLHPEAMSCLTAHMQAPNVVRVQGFLQIVDGQGQPTGGRIPRRSPEEGDLREQVLRAGPGSYVCTPTSGNAWSHCLIESVFPLPERNALPGAADAHLGDVAPLFGKVATVPCVLGSYRIHDSSLMQSQKSLTLDNMKKALRRYQSRVRFLQRVALNRGRKISSKQWARRNWRILTLRYLISRQAADFSAPPLIEHVAAALKGEGALHRRLAATVFAASLRGLPHALALKLARLGLHLEYM